MSVKCNEKFLDVFKVPEETLAEFAPDAIKEEKINKVKDKKKRLKKGDDVKIGKIATEFFSNMEAKSTSTVKGLFGAVDSVGKAIGKGSEETSIPMPDDKPISIDMDGVAKTTKAAIRKLSVSAVVKMFYLSWCGNKVKKKQNYPTFMKINNLFGGILSHNVASGKYTVLSEKFIQSLFVKGSKYWKDVTGNGTSVNLDEAFAFKVALPVYYICKSFGVMIGNFVAAYHKDDVTPKKLEQFAKESTKKYDEVVQESGKEITRICNETQQIAGNNEALQNEGYGIWLEIKAKPQSKEGEENEAISNSGAGNAIKDKKDQDAKNLPEDGKTTAKNQKKSM